MATASLSNPFQMAVLQTAESKKKSKERKRHTSATKYQNNPVKQNSVSPYSRSTSKVQYISQHFMALYANRKLGLKAMQSNMHSLNYIHTDIRFTQSLT